MASQLFAQAFLDAWSGVHNLSGNTIKAALVDSTITPTEATADPHFGGTGTTNLAANEVSGTGYTAGGLTLAGKSLSLVSNRFVFNADDVTFLLNAAGPTNARWCIVYNDTHVNKKAIAFIDLGQVLSLRDADIKVDINASGLFDQGNQAA